MSPLLPPLRTLLRSDADSGAAHRVWRGVGSRRVVRQRAKHRLALLGAFAVGVVAAVLSLKTIEKGRGELTATREIGGDLLRQLGGEAWVATEAPAGGERTVDFNDGSRVALDAGGRLATLENTNHSVVILLATGRAVFDVRPGGPRRWSIEAGLATIEVVGTRFIVNRKQDQVVVEVERGAVLVRGERVPDRVQRLEAGSRLQIDEERISEPAPPSSIGTANPRRVERVDAAREASSWRDLANQGSYAAAYATLGTGGIATRTKTADLDQLLALADVARFSGHEVDAVEPLRLAIAEHARDPRAALAAFTLGRVHLDSLGDSSAAARDFRDALSLGVPQALVEDAYLRLMEAQTKAGESTAAHEAWKEYVERFPNSPRRGVADRWGREP
jgi:transmembrane sensor